MLYESRLFGYLTFHPYRHVCFTYRLYSLDYTLFVSIYNSFDFFIPNLTSLSYSKKNAKMKSHTQSILYGRKKLTIIITFFNKTSRLNLR